MSITELSLFKAHQRISGTYHDVVAQAHLDAAEAAIANRICAPLGDGTGAQAVTADLQVAILLLAGHFFENREAVVTGTIATTMPLGVADLIAPYRRWGAEAGTA